MPWFWFWIGLWVVGSLGQNKSEIRIYQCPYCGCQNYRVFGPGRPKQQSTPHCPGCLVTMIYRESHYQ